MLFLFSRSFATLDKRRINRLSVREFVVSSLFSLEVAWDTIDCIPIFLNANVVRDRGWKRSSKIAATSQCSDQSPVDLCGPVPCHVLSIFTACGLAPITANRATVNNTNITRRIRSHSLIPHHNPHAQPHSSPFPAAASWSIVVPFWYGLLTQLQDQSNLGPPIDNQVIDYHIWYPRSDRLDLQRLKQLTLRQSMPSKSESEQKAAPITQIPSMSREEHTLYPHELSAARGYTVSTIFDGMVSTEMMKA